MNANAAILDNDELAKFEHEQAEKLAPEIVRDLQRMAGDQEAIADKLPADLEGIDAQHAALDDLEQDILREAQTRLAEVARQRQALHRATMRRLMVKEQMLAQKTASERKLLASIDTLATCLSTNVEALRDSADEAAAENHQTEEYGRLYREQYEHAPEPPDDDGGSRAPVTVRDREITEALDDGLTDLVQRMKRHGGGQASAPSLRARVLSAGRAMLNPEPFIRRNASPPYRAA